MTEFMKYGLLFLLSGSLFCGCSSENGELEKTKTLELPVSFNLLSSGSLPTKAQDDVDGHPTEAAKGVREVKVDRVALYVYERAADGVYANDEEGFYLDSDNREKILTCVKQETFPYFIAKGSISIRKNRQYRINAVAYSEKNGERKLFERKGDRFDHTRLSLVNGPEFETPELFFGSVVCGGDGKEHFEERDVKGDTLFTYDRLDQNKGKELLTGWLYRCVAGIELNLENMPDSVRKVELLADSIHTTVDAGAYADFLTPYDLKRNGSYEHYVIGVDSLKEGESWSDSIRGDSARVIGANLLPVCTSLSLRVTTESGKLEYCNLRLRYKDDKSEPTLRSLPGDAGDGTGIIPDNPENPDPDDPDNPDSGNTFRVCFLRNNYYHISGDYEKLTTMSYVLQVSVNPNWEGDVNLPLEK
ncbi:hypothetical protein [Parabacteroides gordonii]|uniref:hypothetical protein n=1 Tax=Parabacteroides gordonii TaxID=574930 RepID=UPI0026EE6783|nr:hypothetical protein [Parabacteroides gordonii]